MMTNLPNVEGALLQPAEPYRVRTPGHEPEKHTVIETRMQTPSKQAIRREGVDPRRDGAFRRHSSDITVDLVREGSNMLALQMRQSSCLTPLAISSKATQALIRQF